MGLGLGLGMGLTGGAQYEKPLVFEADVEDPVVVLDVDVDVFPEDFIPPPPNPPPPLFPPCSKLSWLAPADFSEGDAALGWTIAPCYCRSGENKEHVPVGGGSRGSPDVGIGLGLGCFGLAPVDFSEGDAVLRLV